MHRTVVRYKVKPEHADRNEELVRGVYDELAATRPEGLRYSTVRLDDGVTFIHTADHEDGPGRPLTSLPAFLRFQEGLAERCDEPPVARRAREIGAYDGLATVVSAG